MPGVIRQPVCSLTGHTNVVIAVDWICNGEQLLTASWDRNANVYDVEREEILNVLSGTISIILLVIFFKKLKEVSCFQLAQPYLTNFSVILCFRS